jgi:hypothetical protein
LVRVLPVAQRLGELERHLDPRRQLGGPLNSGADRVADPATVDGVEPGDDRRVVLGGMGERVAGQSSAGAVGQRAVGAQLVDHRAVVGGVDDHAHMGVVLGRGAHHRRPADVDQLDARIGGERVEVADDEVDRRDAVLLHVGQVLGIGRVGEDPAVHLGMQRDDPVPEDGGHARQIRDVDHLDVCVGDGAGRPSRGDEGPAEIAEVTGEVDDAGLVVDGEQCGGHRADRSERCGPHDSDATIPQPPGGSALPSRARRRRLAARRP